ncbi:MAG: NAD(P)-dependent oxidoreductase [bacterium]|nr:NAD(P)-dependent oxidoreductase [bacterium]
MRILFTELEDWEKDYFTTHLGEFEIQFSDAMNDEHLPQSSDAEVLSIFVGSRITPKVLERFNCLRLITTRSTGFDHIDLAACRQRGITVANVPAYGSRTVAEFTFALLLTLSRKTYQAIDRIRESGSFSLDGLRGFELAGKTLGVVGVGNIGREVVHIAKGFSMEVVAYDAHIDEAFAEKNGIRFASLDQLLSESHVVTLHLPYNAQTHHILNAQRLEAMRPGAFLINTARGGLVDTGALMEALIAGHLGGAALDVLEEEGAIKDERELLIRGKAEAHNLKTMLQNHVLIGMPNVIVTPHAAFNTEEALEEILRVTAENIMTYAQHGAPRCPVRM